MLLPDVHGHVHFGAWVLVQLQLQGHCRVLLRDVLGRVPFGAWVHGPVRFGAVPLPQGVCCQMSAVASHKYLLLSGVYAGIIMAVTFWSKSSIV